MTLWSYWKQNFEEGMHEGISKKYIIILEGTQILGKIPTVNYQYPVCARITETNTEPCIMNNI